MTEENRNHEQGETFDLQIGPFFMVIPISWFRGGKS
jgi:hypothetical protein